MTGDVPMSLQQRVEWLCRATGHMTGKRRPRPSISGLGHAAGLSRGTLQNAIAREQDGAGGSLTRHTVEKLVAYANVEAGWLLTGRGSPRVEDAAAKHDGLPSQIFALCDEHGPLRAWTGHQQAVDYHAAVALDAQHLARVGRYVLAEDFPPAPPLPEHGCECSACKVLVKQQDQLRRAYEALKGCEHPRDRWYGDVKLGAFCGICHAEVAPL